MPFNYLRNQATLLFLTCQAATWMESMLRNSDSPLRILGGVYTLLMASGIAAANTENEIRATKATKIFLDE
jgi:hypothetical protein